MSAREIGIPWSDPMVLALLARRKRVTRRMINPQPKAEVTPLDRSEDVLVDGTYVERCRYRVGDHIWGREAWGVAFSGGWVDGFTLCYRADKAQVPFFPPKHSMPDTIGKIKTLHEKWRPPMFMPRWASRLLHRVLDVRPERLLNITEEDAIAEGLKPCESNILRGKPMWRWPGGDRKFDTARACYLAGYDTLHPDVPSKLNPWVWRIEFEPVEAKHV